ncbi:hypothetical protein SNOG_15107 [Parastagonospora nodorum SN15]|uniref:Uncharacterized protein n=1 Tax=Phaeosphaeria nodorum (strain SN15 / ATCC MYA-4574 / FGSC 10173) TaxID=321614 RepID=Q0TZU1_PHANO|nr:hypothetical protein SNOG_15107 [Parastagonospora nodorum SN15]EAT77650.1 hypothetical protein SNOG_15107 [Parastagonospora nodorum SN15]
MAMSRTQGCPSYACRNKHSFCINNLSLVALYPAKAREVSVVDGHRKERRKPNKATLDSQY